MLSRNRTEAKTTILIVAGGTGGHISPGLALAGELHARSHPVAFLSLERNATYPDFASLPFPLFFYAAPRLSRSPGALLLFPFRLGRALLRAVSVIRRERVGAVVGMGGYPTLPALLAARILGVPLHLCEQNVIPGRVTHLFARAARNIFLSLPVRSDAKELRGPKTILTGNPLRREILEHLRRSEEERRARTKRSGGGNAKELRILVMGGSQGALQINRIVAGALRERAELRKNHRWTIQCGESHLEEMRTLLPAEEYPNVNLVGYRQNIFELYSEADLLICRAGAGAITEAACYGLPLILIPYPYAADNHQKENADYFVRNGAALLLEQRDSDPVPLLSLLDGLLSHPDRLATLRENSLRLSRPGATQTIGETILTHLQERGSRP